MVTTIYDLAVFFFDYLLLLGVFTRLRQKEVDRNRGGRVRGSCTNQHLGFYTRWELCDTFSSGEECRSQGGSRPIRYLQISSFSWFVIGIFLERGIRLFRIIFPFLRMGLPLLDRWLIRLLTLDHRLSENIPHFHFVSRAGRILRQF